MTMHVYTICSQSNLNQAILLYNSIKLNTQSAFQYTVFLIDEIPTDFQISDSEFKLIRVDELSSSLPDFCDLNSKYTPFELCCSLKPFCAELLMKKSAQNELIVYLDSDLFFYNDIKKIEKEIGENNILLTPHFTSAPPDFKKISELDVNNSGLYNGGFFTIKNCDDNIQFIGWWKERMKLYCLTDFKNGMFVDQIWLNYIPLYFKNVVVSKNTGLNFAYWNFHERKISKNQNNEWIVNGKELLIFIHFSGFRLYRKDLFSIHQTRYTHGDFPELSTLYLNYANNLESNAKKSGIEESTTNKKLAQKAKLKSILRNLFSKK